MNKSEASESIHFGLRQQLSTGDRPPATATPNLRSGPAVLRKVSYAGLGATVAIVNAMVLTPPAQAQEAAPAIEMPEVVVRGQNDAIKVEKSASVKYTEPLRDTPQTVTVVPEQIVKEQNATTLRDVLRNVPGISIQAGEGGVPAGDNLSIRGFNARTDLFVDGVRDLAGYARDPFNYEQVEVVKGPASAYAGRGSTGGSINLVTKAPKQEAFYRADGGLGTDNYKRFTIDVNQPINFLFQKPTLPTPAFDKGEAKETVAPRSVASESTMAFRLNAMFTESDTPNRSEAGGRRWGIAPSFALGLGTPTTVTFTYMHLDQDNVPDYGIPFVPDTNVPLAKFRGQPAPVDHSNWYGLLDRDFEFVRTDIGSLEIRHSFNDTSTLRYLVRYGHSERDSVIAAPRFLNDNTTDILRELKSRDQEDSILANVIDFTTRFTTFGAEHALVAGVEYDREKQENVIRDGPMAPVADLYHPNPHTNYDGSIRPTGEVVSAESETVSLYLFDTVKLGEHWQLSGGVRYDYNDVDFEDLNAPTGTTRMGRVDHGVSWRAALAYKPVQSGTVYFAYGTSFNPSTEGLTSNFSNTNASLKPEESRTYEVGTKWEVLDGGLLLSGALFRTEKTNARTPGIEPDTPNVLEGEQLVQGFELGVTGHLTRDWAVFGGYTFLHSEIQKSNTPAEVGKDLPNAPQHTFSLWTTYQLPWHLQVGAGAQYVGSRFANATNNREVPDYWTFDAMLRYAINDHFDVRLNVYNLADEEYFDRVSGGHVVPGAGRSATVTVGVQF